MLAHNTQMDAKVHVLHNAAIDDGSFCTAQLSGRNQDTGNIVPSGVHIQGSAWYHTFFQQPVDSSQRVNSESALQRTLKSIWQNGDSIIFDGGSAPSSCPPSDNTFNVDFRIAEFTNATTREEYNSIFLKHNFGKFIVSTLMPESMPVTYSQLTLCLIATVGIAITAENIRSAGEARLCDFVRLGVDGSALCVAFGLGCRVSLIRIHTQGITAESLYNDKNLYSIDMASSGFVCVSLCVLGIGECPNCDGKSREVPFQRLRGAYSQHLLPSCEAGQFLD